MQSTPLVLELYHGRNKTKVDLKFPFFILFIYLSKFMCSLSFL